MPGEQNKVPPIPRETIRTAKAVFAGDNFYVQVGEGLEAILAGIPLESLSESGEAEAVFPMITFFQAMEGLLDSQAVDAARTRIDWKYALHLPVHAPVLRENDLCDFRCRVLSDPRREYEFKKLTERLLALKPPITGRLPGLKSEEVLSTVCSINHIASFREAIGRALQALAVRYPQWLKKIVRPHWYGRYTGFASIPQGGNEEALIQESIADIRYLFEQITRSGAPEILELEEIRTLDKIWSQARDGKETISSLNCQACVHRAAIQRRNA